MTDEQRIAECSEIARERARGRHVTVGEIARRLDLPLDAVIELFAEELSRRTGWPLAVFRVDEETLQ